MPTAAFRLFFNNEPANQQQLDNVEEITVEQEVDMVWEARIKMPIRTNPSGNWLGQGERFMESFSRVRVELRMGSDPFVPLLDGPVVGYDSQMSSEPGQSNVTLQVQDDSIYLNRNEEVDSFDDRTDSEVASDLFNRFEQISSTDIEDTPSQAGNLSSSVVQRGTAMQILRSLARRQDMHAYVWPGDEPGDSIGCFKTLPNEPSGLTPLILLGEERNIESFNITQDSQSPARVQAFALNITDKTVMTSTSSFRDLDLLGPEQAFDDESQVATRLSQPNHSSSVDLDQRVEGETRRSSYSFRVNGQVVAGCYAGVLRPYQVVSVRGVNSRQSGNYLIHSVTHTLSMSSYTQSFSMRRNARSSGDGDDFADVVGRIF